jgi:hypothetical protein
MTLHHGGDLYWLDDLDEGKKTRVRASEDFDYATALGQLHEERVSVLDVDLKPGYVLHLTEHKFKVSAVLASLKRAGISATKATDPHLVVHAGRQRDMKSWLSCCLSSSGSIRDSAPGRVSRSFLIVDRTANGIAPDSKNDQNISKRLAG